MSSNSNDPIGSESELPVFGALDTELAKSVATGQGSREPRSSAPAITSKTAAMSKPAVKSGQSGLNPIIEQIEPQSTGKNRFWSMVPSWLISTVVHVGAILILAAWNIEPIQKELKLMLVASESTGEEEALEDSAFEDAMTAELQSEESQDSSSESPIVDPMISDSQAGVNFSDFVAANMPTVTMTGMTESLIPKEGLAAQANAALRAGLSSRSKEAKRDMLSKYGGSTDTEKAVSAALKWLSLHQDPQTGAWSLTHSLVCKGQCDHAGNRRYSLNAATGLALMCFLGAGQTHMEGEYKETVFKGLSFLIKNIKLQKGLGRWYVGKGGEGYDDMYAHGIATIAMCEAYGMTRDPALFEAAQAGVNFLAYAQNPSTGGWHYAPQGLGDTSVVGWQMMALKSAAMSGLSFDLDVVRKANSFLDQMAWGESGSFYHYSFASVKKQAAYNKSTTACAVLCRMYSGVPKDHPSIKIAVERFSKDGPGANSTYYNYYATQVMKQIGGDTWEKWNVRMRDKMVASQEKVGHAAGSWYWPDGHSTESGGRLYTTCMATMMLEVYYRYMPLYAEQSEEDTFKL